MKKLAYLPVVVALVSCGGSDGPSARHLIIFHTNDEHSHQFGHSPEIDDFPPPTTPGTGVILGGVARRAKVLSDQRASAAAAGADTLTFSAGDESQGTLTQLAFTTSAPDFTLLGTLHYDAMCPGNHEFDLGPAAYAAAITAARANGGLPQIVASNIHFSATDARDDSLAALYGEGTSDQPIKRYHVITTASGLKVGLVGIVGVQASFYAPYKVPVLFSAPADKEGDLTVGMPALYADLQPVVDDLRNVEKVDVVIALSHSGVDTTDQERGEDVMIAEHVSGIDLIVSGHSHTPLPAPQLATAPDGYVVPVVQAGSYGEWLGKVDLEVTPGQRPKLVSGELIKIDDTIVPDDAALLAQLETLIKSLEAQTGPGSIADQLGKILGAPVSDDPTVVGDLYYKAIGTTDFDVIGLRSFQETEVLDLSTDAMLAEAEAEAGPTMLAVQAAGAVRADIKKGKTGKLSFADLFRVFPLGSSPTDGSLGYPLCRFYLWTVEIRAAFEIAASQGLINDSVFLSPSGIKVEFDTSRPEFDLATPLDTAKGRVTKITVDTDHSDGVDAPDTVLYDVTLPDPWTTTLGNQFTLHPVVTSYYVASFAATAGVMLKDEAGNFVDLDDTIMTRQDGSEVKELEALLQYLVDQGGVMPDRYDESTLAGTVPRRMICSGPLCP
jgi:5'-nucleotidase